MSTHNYLYCSGKLIITDKIIMAPFCYASASPCRGESSFALRASADKPAFSRFLKEKSL
ncbi:MAG: hypothetical protein HYY60_02960 [Parcubacteria group bacterium]|nr:hypothetical protein [Parcubacteria group bacterium]